MHYSILKRGLEAKKNKCKWFSFKLENSKGSSKEKWSEMAHFEAEFQSVKARGKSCFIVALLLTRCFLELIFA